MLSTRRENCRNCQGELLDLFSLGEHKVNDFPATPDDPGVVCPIEMVMCLDCKLVQQRWTAPADMLWSNKYWYRSGVNESMREALKEVADEAMRRVDFSLTDSVLDIGSNDGTFLRCLPEYLTRVGIEPAENLATFDNYKGMHLVQGFWGSGDTLERTKHIVSKVKLVTALGMLYDLEDPNEFVADVSRILHPEGVFVAQLTCLKQTVLNNDVGNLCHEHLLFYILKNLEEMYARNGLRIFDVQENGVNGGSYRIWASKSSGYWRSPAVDRFQHIEKEMGLDNAGAICRWWERVEEIKQKILHSFESLASRWVYGASTKGNTILQWLGVGASLFNGAADRSPEKHGRYTVTGIPIRSEEEFRDETPNVALVLPWGFLDQFVEREEEWLIRGGRFLTPLPKPMLVGFGSEAHGDRVEKVSL